MGAGCLRRGDDGVVVRFGRHPGDVLGDRPIEQVDRLRHIADFGAQAIRRPMVERSSVDPNRALRGRPYSHQRPDQ